MIDLKSRSQMRRVATQKPGVLVVEIERLRAELAQARKHLRESRREYAFLVRRYLRFADADAVIRWIREGTQQAVFAFTSGPERSIAWEIEHLWMRKGQSHLDVDTPAKRRNRR